jgi:hypothetical protein
MKLIVLVFVFIAAGVTAGKPSAPSRAATGSIATSSIQTNNVQQLLCCGGPACIPHEPCGSGSTVI